MTEVKNKIHYCPSDNDLMAYKLNKSNQESSQDITEHLVICEICYENLMKYLPETEDEWQESLKVDNGFYEESDVFADGDDFLSPTLLIEFEEIRQNSLRLEKKCRKFSDIGLSGLKAGQFWRPKVEEILVPAKKENKYFSDYELGSINHFVVIESEPEKIGDFYLIKIVPVDDDLSRTDADDIIIGAKFNPLEKDLLLQVWNSKEMLVKNLEGFFGEIDPRWIETKQTESALPVTGESRQIGELFTAFRKNFGDFVYEPLNIIREGLIANPIYRYRAKEVAETNYLSFPAVAVREIEQVKNEVPEYMPVFRFSEPDSSLLGKALRLVGLFLGNVTFSQTGRAFGAAKEEGRIKIEGFDYLEYEKPDENDRELFLELFTSEMELDNSLIVLEAGGQTFEGIFFKYDPHECKANFYISEELQRLIKPNSRVIIKDVKLFQKVSDDDLTESLQAVLNRMKKSDESPQQQVAGLYFQRFPELRRG